ncbi:YbaN family protein [Ohessyouella blattaphilus]|uniref:YbaN family protein n=1 Tax=Ohessyouella blattaphilus TaxID=2949333 RepID=A0ABT1EIW6_9FIRM|nr:YbaN family protein [Ohessyouella blattaphilus]MCP1110648.1 YbaN family protein [Ohessyouella blattaphilus]MCR8564042.1 YbaN family protein [Ohessyouella blattaphilus]
MKTKIKKAFFIVIGLLGLGLGAVGAVVPVLPTFPFLMVAALCFARSSKKLNDWFLGTKLYKNNLESYVKGEGMTKKTKVKVMITVTALMTIGFIMMHQIPLGQLTLFLVWVFHIFYFWKVVKVKNEEA